MRLDKYPFAHILRIPYCTGHVAFRDPNGWEKSYYYSGYRLGLLGHKPYGGEPIELFMGKIEGYKKYQLTTLITGEI